MADSDARIATWTGELLWPQDLPAASVIDCSTVVALGVWCHEWFRRHPGLAVVAAPDLRDRLHRAGVPVRCFATVAAALAAADGGVSASEREMLWG